MLDVLADAPPRHRLPPQRQQVHLRWQRRVCPLLVAAHAAGLVAEGAVVVGVVRVDVVRALAHADLAGDAAVFVALDAKLGGE